MQPYSIDLRKKIIEVRQQENISIIKLAERFKVAKSFVQRLLKRFEQTGDREHPGFALLSIKRIGSINRGSSYSSCQDKPKG